MIIENPHSQRITDTQLDYYGTKLATCSCDGTIKIYDIVKDQPTLVDTINAHNGPVWRVAWSAPVQGKFLASAGYDGVINIWGNTNNSNKWQLKRKFNVHSASVNSIAWAPLELGSLLLCGSNDGKVSIIDLKSNENPIVIEAHKLGVNSVCWYKNSFVTGGQCGSIKIWKQQDEEDADSKKNGRYIVDEELNGHSDSTNDVAWSPAASAYIATVGEDGVCNIWSKDSSSGKWTNEKIIEKDIPLGRVSWSPSGNILAVSANNGNVTYWKETIGGTWEETELK